MAYYGKPPLSVPAGATGRATATAYAVITGGTTATGAHQSIASVGTQDQVLSSNGAGALPTFGTAAVAGGGSGRTSATEYALITGGTTTTGPHQSIASVGTQDQVLSSNGAGALPTFGTAAVAGGGSGRTTATAYAVITGGTTSTGAHQSIASVGTSGQVLTSNGAAALPTFQNAPGGGGFTSVVIQSFTANGTYTPTSGMDYCIVEVVGGGGGGGAGTATGGGSFQGGGGGGGGGYARKVFAAATIGASQTVTIGALGAGGTAPSGTGGTGGTTTFGALLTGNGGTGGGGPAGGGNMAENGGAGGTGASGDINISGGSGWYTTYTPSVGAGGVGGGSYFGQAGDPLANNFGCGGGGGRSAGGAGLDGQDGGPGVCIVTEYIS